MEKMSRSELDIRLDEFVSRMRQQLYKNEHKGGWTLDDLGAMLDRLDEETQELKDAIKSWDGWEPGKPKQGRHLGDVLNEAADVANFAMMIADICHYRMPNTWYHNPRPSGAP